MHGPFKTGRVGKQKKQPERVRQVLMDSGMAVTVQREGRSLSTYNNLLFNCLCIIQALSFYKYIKPCYMKENRKS